ncbi:MAG: MtnX-like HAD-IB family phosphatase [Firmicutes bacterium]|nr:MtnX-like HAD-IB family phosphatase [Bacillota bacterium]
MKQSMIIFTDFDGTISAQDVCATMVQRFAAPGWQELNRLWEAGKLSTKECAQQTLDLMSMPPAEFDAFVEKQEIDPYFIDFTVWAKEQGYPIYILSDGYHNYITPMLARYNIRLPFYANPMHYRQRRGWQIETPYENPRCGRCGVCKSKIMLDFMLEPPPDPMQPNRLNVYIGDGHSDRCPANFGDLVFARANRSLAAYCAREGIPAQLYNNFQDILKILKREQPCSS